jgi:ribosome biogenesis GTPase
VVASNLDQVVVVAAMRRPEFRHGLVDRIVVQSVHEGLAVFLALNKADLGEAGEADDILAEYARAGIRGAAVCATDGAGVAAVRAACTGRRSLFVGHSGVGKSTLLAALAPGLELLAGEVNEKTGKGRHTTTHALLLEPEPGLELIDTPGVRAFALWGVDGDTLVEYYPELRPHLGGCRFGDCRHDREPGCAVREAHAAGAIGERRWQSFLKLRAELHGGHP